MHSVLRILFYVAVCFAVLATAYPAYEDLEAAATGHDHGRVQIKVYRGPGDHHHAPWGFWVKQPADH